MIELLVFILVVGTIIAFVARGGAAGSIVLTLISIVVGVVLGTCAFVPFALALYHAGFGPAYMYIILWAIIVGITSLGTYVLGLLTMPRDG